MNKEDKKAVLKALLEKVISKEEAKELLESDIKDRIFKSVTYSTGDKIFLDYGNRSLIEVMNKAKVEFITINRRIISK